MLDKQRNAYRHQREMRRRAYASTACLREEFPQVEQLVLEMHFTDPRGIVHYSPQMHSFSPGARAFFAVACPCSMCIDGGYDLAPVIAQMMDRGDEDAAGTMECPGWQHPDRAEQHRCRVRMHYHLAAHYNH